jgi:predicted deacylase
MTLGTAHSEPGAITRGHVELGSYPDAPILSAAMVATGRHDGPTLWVQAGVHGPEVVGQLAIARFLRGLDLDALRGRIVCLMVANPLGFRGYNRLTPQDGMNLNRVFPGKPDGTVSEQLAHRVLELALSTGDVLLDLHSGGDLTITPFYVIYPKGPEAAAAQAAALSRGVGSRFQWGSDEDWMNGSFITNAVRQGKPALIVESGGGARVWDEDLGNMQTALEGLCRGMGLLPGDAPTARDIRYGGNAVHLKSGAGGFWHPLVAPGNDVVAGQELGHIINIWGDVTHRVQCAYTQGWVGSIRRPFMPVYAGDQVIELVESVGGPR